MSSHKMPQNKNKTTVNEQIQVNGLNHSPLSTDLEIIQLNCNNVENKLTEGLRNIDSKQIHLQNRINELENAFSIVTSATRAPPQYTDFDDEQTFLELNEKVRTTALK